MVRFVTKRVLSSVLLILLVVTVIFLALHTVPGDPAQALVGGDVGASEEALKAVRAELGLDKPLIVQYWIYLTGLAAGNMGTSFRNGTPVLESILTRLPNTLELVVGAGVLAVVGGLILGSLASRRGRADTIISALVSVWLAIPVYVLGTIFVLAFAIHLHWFPAGGLKSWATPLEHAVSLVLPMAALALGFVAVVTRTSRGAILEAETQDWVRTAIAKGVHPRKVFARHVLRNSLTPVTTIVGLEVGTLLGSTVVIERVFNFPGLSSLLVDAVANRDYPIVQGVVIVTAVLFIAINACVDIAYGALDPRARLS